MTYEVKGGTLLAASRVESGTASLTCLFRGIGAAWDVSRLA